MAVVQYWAGRLRDGSPLWGRHDVQMLKAWPDRPDAWPKAVAKQAMYADYLMWFDGVYLPPFRETPRYQHQPELLPEPAREFDFFVTLSPFIHIVHRDKQTRAYFIKEQRQHNGRWIDVRVRKNFVRLCEWGEHVAAFELQTGMLIHGGLFCGANLEAIETVAAGAQAILERIEANKGRMAIGSVEDA